VKPHPITHALIVVDVQNDFVTGSLAVPDGAAVVPVVNRLREAFATVVFTKDWHPANHGSFAVHHPGKQAFEQIELNGLPQTLWPVHCVQGEAGAELVAGLNTGSAHVFLKGTDPEIDSYSGFFDNGRRKATGLGEFLKTNGITDVFVCGLATDYCVKATALDAARLGFQTHLIEDASRGIRSADVAGAIEAMRAAGVRIVTSADVAGS
jgi:nicotinamidase/pyrazinamidase